MKRRVYHLAKKFDVKDVDALSILKRHGYHLNSIYDQISEHDVQRASLLINNNDPEYITNKLTNVSQKQNTNIINPLDIAQIQRKDECSVNHNIVNITDNYSNKSKIIHFRYLTTNDLLAIHDALVIFFAAENDPIFPPGPKDIGLLDSASHRPMTAINIGNSNTIEKYTTIHRKAAALFHSMIKNHPFHNGNKRTALVALLIFLENNDITIDANDDRLFEFVINTAIGNLIKPGPISSDNEVEKIEEWIKSHSIKSFDYSRSMKTTDFLDAVQKAGGRYKRQGGGGRWVIWGPNGDSVRFNQNNNKLNGSVIRKYLQKIGLSPGQSGIHFNEFEEGLDPNQKLIRRFRMVLKKLSHA
jgi:death-on-curing family protein